MLTIGLVELNSIARGIETCDIMAKASDVELIDSYPVCPGKYIIMVSGNVAAVQSSVERGIETASANFVDKLILPHVHPQVIPGLMGTAQTDHIQAVGILETFSVASAIIAADASLKAARVDIIEIRIAKGLGGKSFYTLTGNVAEVQAAIDSAALIVEKEGVLVYKTVIPNPHESLKQQLLEW
ncbi:MAG: BMC domain-containing protein [Spirochaetes bacterium]|nr:BMC domain-containing protein [Spirochaetota bacterium]